MTLTKPAALALLAILAAGSSSAFAQTAIPPATGTTPQSTQTQQRPMRPDRAVEVTQVKPGVWVNGTPKKPIFSGDMPIYPEAYDNMPAKLP
jgi:hypothetical protein